LTTIRTRLLNLILDNCLGCLISAFLSLSVFLLCFLRLRVQETWDSGGANSCYRNVVFVRSSFVHSHVLSLCFYSEICTQVWF